MKKQLQKNAHDILFNDEETKMRLGWQAAEEEACLTTRNEILNTPLTIEEKLFMPQKQTNLPRITYLTSDPQKTAEHYIRHIHIESVEEKLEKFFKRQQLKKLLQEIAAKTKAKSAAQPGTPQP